MVTMAQQQQPLTFGVWLAGIISREDVMAIVGRTPDVLVPSDRSVVRSVNQGEPISLMQRRSDAARAFRVLAELYRADDPTLSVNGKRPRRRLRLRRRSA